jgi:hypothetical protein|nr:hypothetical protein Q903MT_gene1027 [Picea sitchensis]
MLKRNYIYNRRNNSNRTWINLLPQIRIGVNEVNLKSRSILFSSSRKSISRSKCKAIGSQLGKDAGGLEASFAASAGGSLTGSGSGSGSPPRTGT